MARRRSTTDAGSGMNVEGSPAEIFDKLSRVERPVAITEADMAQKARYFYKTAC
jgi:hypothetical protein